MPLCSLLWYSRCTNPRRAGRNQSASRRARRRKAPASRADLANRQPASLRLDETELNSYLATHLTLEGSSPAANAPPADRIPILVHIDADCRA